MVEVVTEFNRKNRIAHSRYFVRGMAIGASVSILLFAIIRALWAWAAGDSANKIIFGALIFLAICLVVCAIVILFCFWLLPKHATKKNNLMPEGKSAQINFDSDSAVARWTNKDGTETIINLLEIKLRYLIEDKKHFFLYVNYANCFVIPKKDIISGTADELRAHLKNHWPKTKYRRVKI